MSKKPAKLLYVLAASHSGSTLSALLLNAHPDICTTGELKLGNLSSEDDYRCSCQTPIADCPFWFDVKERMAALGHPFDPLRANTGLDSFDSTYVRRILRPLHRGHQLERVRDAMLRLSPSWSGSFPSWQQRNLALVKSVTTAAGANIVVDSSKTAVRLKYLLTIKDLEVKVLRLVRDGRAVALTYMDASRFADASDPSLRGGGSGKQQHEQLSMSAAATLWRRSNKEAEEVLKTLPEDRQIVISYEDLCEQTDSVLKRVHSFLGLEHSDRHKEFRSAPHHVVGNGMRMDSSSEVRLDDRWKGVLSRAQLDEFQEIAGHLNSYYGYR